MEDADEKIQMNPGWLKTEGKSHPLKPQMRAFISKHNSTANLKTLREEVATGKQISEIVTKARDGRI